MIKSKTDLVNTINSELSDNATGAISPLDIRHNLIDIIDSVHNLLDGKDIDALNVGTPASTSVRLGDNSLSKLDLAGYSTSGNTAVGFSALENNYQAVRNTALGAYALSCNIHGYDNVGVGYSSLAGNTTGFANIGIGGYTSHGNKTGDFNIAIGHGAGYYMDKDERYQFYVAAHPVDANYVCANPNGHGLVPLMYGDLQYNRLGINTRGLHSEAHLQVSGNVAASKSSTFDLGAPTYKWRYVYSDIISSSEVRLDTGKTLSAGASGIHVSGDLIPTKSTYNLGSDNSKWNKLYVDHFTANSGTVVSQSNYIDHTLFLASSGSGPFVGYLTEPNLINAGLVIRASGFTNPQFVFDSSGNTCGETFRRWKSNIGIELESGEYLRATSFVSPEACHGLHLVSGQQFSTSNHIFNNDIDNIAGSGHVNFIADSGINVQDYKISYLAQNSGVNISQSFLSRCSDKVSDDQVTGFIFKYFDEHGSPYSSSSNIDRFAISSYDDNTTTTNSIILMKNAGNSGVFGINDFTNGDGHLAIPNTIFNVRSRQNATARITSEVVGNSNTRLQLMGHCNNEADGLEFSYVHPDNVGDINMYKESGLTQFMRFHPTSGAGHNEDRIGILASGEKNSMLTLGCADIPRAAISLFSHPSTETATSGYGKIYAKDLVVTGGPVHNGQTHSLYFVDGSGTHYDLVDNECNPDSDAPFTFLGNLGIGQNSLKKRCNNNIFRENVALGHHALQDIHGEIDGLLNIKGSYNTAVGYKAGQHIGSGTYNIAIGHNALCTTSNAVSHNIVIGQGIGETISTDYNFLVGMSGQTPLMTGNLQTQTLKFPNGKLHVNNNDSTKGLVFDSNSITLIDHADREFTVDSMAFEFETPTGVKNLLTLNHSSSGISKTPTYESPANPRPYGELKGDLKLLGAIRFSDGTSIDSAGTGDGGDLYYVSGIAIQNQSAVTGLVREGFALQDIEPATHYGSSTTGTIRNSSTLLETPIVNRDRHTKIKQGDFVIAIKVGIEYRPIWVSNENSVCNCCSK